jgi:hypothetical protein
MVGPSPVYARRLSGKRSGFLKTFEVGEPAKRRSQPLKRLPWRRRAKPPPESGGQPLCPPELDLHREQLGAIRDALSGATVEGPRDPPPPLREEPYGICLSGGGVRSASYCLGVLQEMTRHGMLHHTENDDRAADFLASVSGGSYIAGAFAMINRGEYPKEPPDRSDRRAGSKPTISPGSLPAFAPKSPEERYLRDHMRYLTHGFGGIFGLVWRLVAGISWNFVILILAVGALSVPLGWIYGAAVPSLRAHCSDGCGFHHFDFPGWFFWVAIGLGLAALAVAMAWVAHQWQKEGVRRTLAGISLACLAAGVLWLLAVVAVPLLLEWIRTSVGVHAVNHRLVPSNNSTATIGAVSGAGALASGLTAIFGARALRTAQVVWSKVPAGDKQTIGNRAKTLLLKARVPLLNLLAMLIAPVTIAAIVVLGLHVGSLYRPFTLGASGTIAFVAWLGGVGLLCLAWRFGDLNSWSMHPFYRERLSAAFALKRFKACEEVWSPTSIVEDDRLIDATRRPYDPEYLISESQPDLFPELIICAAANVSKYGATPTKAPVTSFVLSRRDIGGPVIGAWPALTYEAVLDKMPKLKRNLTQPAAVAMSGASISPEMGRMTRAPLRFLLTMLNIRLGLWIPNPNRLAEFAVRNEPHVRHPRPGLTYLLREMFGKDNPESKFLYVTDGGHYENLGLVELLRRHCRYVWCVDASGEQQDTFSTIAGAVALAFSDLGCRIEIDPAKDMAPVPAITKARAAKNLRPVVKRTFSVGTIYYDPNDLTDIGRLVIIKTGVPDDAPDDVSDFYENDKKSFPCDSTLDQLYTADRFDAYRSLGVFGAHEALTYCWNDFTHYLETGRPSADFLPTA